MKTDSEMQNNVQNAFKWNWAVPNDSLKVKAEHGWVTLKGEVAFYYQKEAKGI